MKSEKIKGGLADKMTAKDLAEKHGVSLKQINREIEMGIKVELEHVDDKVLAKEIAMDHLFEIPDYYTRLKKMETEAKKELKIKESLQKELIKKLIRENIELIIADKTSTTNQFDIYYKKRLAGKLTLGTAPSALGPDTLEIIDLYLDDEYTNLNVANQAIKSLWVALPDTNRFVVNVPKPSEQFWNKLGFQRLNDYYHMIMRGH